MYEIQGVLINRKVRSNKHLPTPTTSPSEYLSRPSSTASSYESESTYNYSSIPPSAPAMPSTFNINPPGRVNHLTQPAADGDILNAAFHMALHQGHYSSQ